MKRFSCLGLILILSQNTLAYTANFDALYKVQRVSTEFAKIVAGKTAIDIHQFQKEDRDQIALLKDRLSSRLKVTSEGNKLTFDYENKATAVLELDDDKIYLNGVQLKINPEVSLTQNLRNWGLSLKSDQRTSRVETIWNLMNARAMASTTGDQAAKAATSIVSSGVNAFQNYAAVVYTSEGAAAAVAAGSAATVSTAVIVTAAAVVAGLAVVAIAACENEAVAAAAENNSAKSEERLNCYSKPLSWFKVNSRDRLYLQNINCSKDQSKIAVEYESQTHKNLKIDLLFEKSELVDILPEDPSKKAQVIKELENKTFKNKFVEEVSSLKQFCEDPQKIAQFKKVAASVRKQGKVFTGSIKKLSPGAK